MMMKALTSTLLHFTCMTRFLQRLSFTISLISSMKGSLDSTTFTNFLYQFLCFFINKYSSCEGGAKRDLRIVVEEEN